MTRGEALDHADPLSGYLDRFVPSEGLVAYLDGNSLGRPLAASVDRVADFLVREWGGRLIRGWDDDWLELPFVIGDELGRVALGAAAGQVFIGDSTSVLLYKLARAALAASPGRTEIVLSRQDFPTDRYVLEGIAHDLGLSIVWLDAEAEGGVTPAQLAGAVGPSTALVVLSHVAYRSAYIAEGAELTRIAHDAGAFILWDLSHSAGAVPVDLDAWGANLAVGCGYKYLNGGPGAPAFAYVRRDLQSELRQPIQGWLGSRAPFEMGEGYEPADGIRRFQTGTPPIVGMLAMRDMIALLDEAGTDAVRAKSEQLTAFAIELTDELLPEARLASPRDPERRGSHVTLDHPGFAEIVPRLWREGVIPDSRRPDGIRLGLSPLSTSFAEVQRGVEAIARLLG